jgi:hypothetical protein
VERLLLNFFAEYHNVGGTKFQSIGDGTTVDLSTQEELFGGKQYDYFVTNLVVSGGVLKAMPDHTYEKVASIETELVAVGNNVMKPDGRTFHFGADLINLWDCFNNLFNFMDNEVTEKRGNDCYIISNIGR